ncbi:MAG: DUF1127 domain-containing protein [Geminicoccaceae bacterium]|nr:DUF1127 domain-containing protein [Geminicoccaceae bacterium]
MRAVIHPSAAPHTAVAFGPFLRLVLERLAVARQVARERRRLGALSDRDLRDMGIDRLDARREAERGFWDLPPERLIF